MEKKDDKNEPIVVEDLPKEDELSEEDLNKVSGGVGGFTVRAASLSRLVRPGAEGSCDGGSDCGSSASSGTRG